MKYWLMKSEPSEFSIDDLAHVKRSAWDGVRNYQVRNMMRDEMQIGDLAFFYHSNAKPTGIAGIMEICQTAYPDPSAFDPENKHYDPRSKAEKPSWLMVDVKFQQKFRHILTLEQLRNHPALSDLLILRKGNRLSITPLAPSQWEIILKIAN